MAVFYNQKDQDIYKTSKFMPQSRFLLNALKPVVKEEKITESFGIPQTQAFTNSSGGGGGGGIQTLDPYNRPQGKPLDPNSFLGKTFTGLKNFGGTVVDKFSGLPGVKQGKGLISNIMDNTMIGRFAAMRNPLNPNASNYNKALQGQIDYLSGLSVDDKMYIGRDPNSGLSKYGPDSVLSGQNVVSAFGTNDYKSQLQKNLERLEGYGKNGVYKPATLKAIKKTEDEIKGLEDEDDKNYQDRIDSFVKSYKRPGVKELFETVYDGNNIHNNPPGGDSGGGGGGGAPPGFGITAQGNYTNQFEGGDPGQGSGDTESQTNSQAGVGGFADYADGGRAGYFFGGRVNYKVGGRTDAGANRSTASKAGVGQINEAGNKVDGGNYNDGGNDGSGGGIKPTFYDDKQKIITTDFISKKPSLTIDYTNPKNYASIYSKMGFNNLLDNDDLTVEGDFATNMGPVTTNTKFTDDGIGNTDINYGNFSTTIDPNKNIKNIGYNNSYNGINYGVNYADGNTMFNVGTTFKNGGLAGLL